MADASPVTDRSRFGRRRQRNESSGEPCTMCGRTVQIGSDGRCRLGHRVMSAVEAAERGYDESALPLGQSTDPGFESLQGDLTVEIDLADGLPATVPAAFSVAHPSADNHSRPAVGTTSVERTASPDDATTGRDRLPVNEPLPDLPSPEGPIDPDAVVSRDHDGPLHIPDRLRTPIPPASNLFTQTYDDDRRVELEPGEPIEYDVAEDLEQTADLSGNVGLGSPQKDTTEAETEDGPAPTAGRRNLDVTDFTSGLRSERSAPEAAASVLDGNHSRALVLDRDPDAVSVLDDDAAVPTERTGPDPEESIAVTASDTGDSGDWADMLQPRRRATDLIAAVVFVVLLVAIAWYLAVSI